MQSSVRCWSRVDFGGNVESKKMQKNVLKQQFENFSVSDTEGLDKAYDRFQKLISLLEVHGAVVPNEDANQKFLRALPSSWNNVALIMRVTVCDEDTSSSNEVNTANGVSTASGHNSQGQASSSSYTDDLMFSFFANQSNSPQLDDEDLEQIDHDDLEEIDLKWQVAMLSMRVKQFYKKPGRKLIFNGKEPVGFDKTKVKLTCHRRGHFAREYRASRNQGNRNGDAGYRSRDNTRRIVPVETSDALVVQDNALIVQDRLGYDWSYIAQDEPTEFALMAYTSNSSGPTANKTSASVSQVETGITPPSNTSVEMPRVESVRPSGVIIEDWVSDDDEDIFQFNDLQATDKSTFKKIKFTNARNESIKPKQVEKPRITTQNPKVDRRDWNGKMTQKLGLGFGSTKKAYFVCGSYGSYSHLIKDCDFHEKRMAKKSVLKNIGKKTGQKEIRPVWNNVQRINHQNKFVPSAVLISYKSSDETYKNDTANDAAGETPIQKPASENEKALKNVLDKMMDQEKEATEQSDAVRKEFEAQCNRELLQGKATKASSTNKFNTVSTPVNAANDPLMPDLEDTAEVQNTAIFGSAYDDDDLDTYNSPYADQVMGAEADFNNMEPSTVVSPIPTTRVHSIHPKNQIIGDPKSAVQIRGMSKKNFGEHAKISYIQKQRRTNHKDFQNCLFACFLSQQEPTKIAQALDDERWVYRNKKDERGIVVRNKARLVAQGYKQEEGIDYDEVFAPIARIKAIRLFLAYASFMNFVVSQMDVKSTFLYGTIKDEDNDRVIERYLISSRPRYYVSVLCYAIDFKFNKSFHLECSKKGALRYLKGDCLGQKSQHPNFITASHVVVQVLWIKNQMGRLMVFKCSGVYTSTIWIEVGMDYNWAITTAASLDAAQDSDNIIRTQTTTMTNVDIRQGMDTGGSSRRQDTMGVLLLRLGLRECLNNPLNHLFEKCLDLKNKEGCSSCGDPQTKEKNQGIQKTKEVKHLITKKEEIQTELRESTMAFEVIKLIKSMALKSRKNVLDYTILLMHQMLKTEEET
ncbi:reverse transcriptase domain-containing protein [Tanacetum coccineum]